MKASFSIIVSCLLLAVSFVLPAFGQQYIRVDEHDKLGNEVVVYRDAVTGVGKRIWHDQRLVLSIFDSTLADREGSFIGMVAVNRAVVERIVPKILRFYDTLLNINIQENLQKNKSKPMAKNGISPINRCTTGFRSIAPKRGLPSMNSGKSSLLVRLPYRI